MKAFADNLEGQNAQRGSLAFFVSTIRFSNYKKRGCSFLSMILAAKKRTVLLSKTKKGKIMKNKVFRLIRFTERRVRNVHYP